MPITEIASLSGIAAEAVEKVGSIKEVVMNEVGKLAEIMKPDIETIKTQSLETLKTLNAEKVITAETEVEEFRPLTEKEALRIQKITKMSNATIERCTINEEGVVKLNCINEELLGGNTEIPYVEKIIDVNGIDVKVVVPEFPNPLFQFEIPKDMYLLNDYDLFKYCTEQLAKAIEQNPELAKQFTPQQLEQIQKGLPRITGLTWHHCAECGKMELIPTKVHSQFRHTGGKSIWGGGRLG